MALEGVVVDVGPLLDGDRRDPRSSFLAAPLPLEVDSVELLFRPDVVGRALRGIRRVVLGGGDATAAAIDPGPCRPPGPRGRAAAGTAGVAAVAARPPTPRLRRCPRRRRRRC